MEANALDWGGEGTGKEGGWCYNNDDVFGLTVQGRGAGVGTGWKEVGGDR